jgi:MFS family permease
MGQVREATSAFSNVFRNGALRRINLALAGSVIGDWAFGIAIAVWAYDQGGAAAVGVFGVIRFVTLALTAPLAAGLADRFPKKAVMIAADLVRGALVLGSAGLIASDAPAVLVYALALVTSMLGTAFRPAQASLIPTLARDPGELTSANVVASTVESVGFFAGPAIGGFLLAVADVSAVLVFDAATFVWSAIVLSGMRVPAGAAGDDADPMNLDTGDDAGVGGSGGRLAGFRAIAGDRDLRTIAALYVAQTTVAGASIVFEVAIVFEMLERGESTLGLVNAVLGIGGLLGGAVALALARRERLATDFGFGVMLWAAPLLLIVAWPTLPAVLIAMLLIGLANSLVDVNAFTIIQRVTDEAVMGRVFGALESFVIGGMALGALLMPILVETIGTRAGLAVLGGAITVVAVLGFRRLSVIDATVLAPPGLSLLRGVPMLSTLPQSQLERLARSLGSMTVPAGRDVFREGDRGDRYWIIERGRVQVTQEGRTLRELGPGDGFGEIALIRDIPRTATVTALTDLELKGLDREDFLLAVTSTTEALDQAEQVVSRFLTLS